MMYDVQIEPLGPLALFDLRGAMPALADWCGQTAPEFPAAALTSTSARGLDLMWVGPDQWILRAPLESENDLISALKPTEAPDDISIVQITDAYTFFKVSGPEAAEVLSIASPLDVHPSVFPENSATFTEVFQTRALLIKAGTSFDIAVDRSYGAMFADYFARATAGELGDHPRA